MLSILLIGVSETGGAEKNKTWARLDFCRKYETKTSTCLSYMPFCPFLHLITTKCSWLWCRVLEVVSSEMSHLLSRMVMLQYFSNLVLICLFVKIVPKRPLLVSVCHVCHNQRGIERHSCLDPTQQHIRSEKAQTVRSCMSQNDIFCLCHCCFSWLWNVEDLHRKPYLHSFTVEEHSETVRS